MIVYAESINESMFNYQLEMVNLQSSLAFDMEYAKYVDESENIFIKIKNKVISIIQRIIDFIKDKLGIRTKEVADKCEKKTEAKPKEKPADSSNNNESKPKPKKEERKDVYVVKDDILDSLERWVENFVNVSLDRRLNSLNYFKDWKNNRSVIKDALTMHSNSFKEKGILQPLSDKTGVKITDSSSMISHLKQLIVKDSGYMEKWGQDNMSHSSFDRYMGKYKEQIKNYIKLQQSLTKALEQYKNTIKKIDLTGAPSDILTIFNDYNTTILHTIDAHLGIITYILQATNNKVSLPMYIG